MSGKLEYPGINDLILASVKLAEVPSPFDNRSIPRVVDREHLLHPEVQRLPIKWLELVRSSFSLPPISLLHPTSYYPLQHHKQMIRDWYSRHPAQQHPCEMRWNLNSLSGGVEDNCHPPYRLFTLIAAALNGAPGGKLTSMEVRLTLMIRFNFFLTEGPDWHSEVDSILEDMEQQFTIFRRKTTPHDTGCLYGLRYQIPNTSEINIYLRPQRDPARFQICQPSERAIYEDTTMDSPQELKLSQQRSYVQQWVTNTAKYFKD
ncbi:hypothetical protein Clacol_003362 [Clathrus columnatus]|uniref:Fork-head domain-containing protein n=1 Tax=Clathrus columnatus TaxID=1419009 RepID=A0AAV5A837_9AGAM|nr:hypothetical protein Clacol_003362 [Clathrus columnatus]